MNKARFERLHKICREILTTLSRRYFFRPDELPELEQEMARGLLEADATQSDGYCLVRAVWGAKSYLRKVRKWRRECRLLTLEEITALVDNGLCRRVWC